jgi:predicted transcriptional regulator
MIDAVVDAGSKFRRVHARALYEEGLTMDEIAALFGVTRQRVSAVLRKSGATTAAPDKQTRLSSPTEQNGEN